MKKKYLIIPVTLLIAITMVVAADQNQNTTWNMAENGIPRMQEQGSSPEPGDHATSTAGEPLEKAPQPQNSLNDSLTFILEQGPNDLRVAKLIGMPVFGVDGMQIAHISDLILNPDNQKVTAVVMTSGGIFGIGGKHIALPLDDLDIPQVTTGKKRSATVDLTKQDIENAPELRSKGTGYLTVISTTPLVNRTEKGDRNYRFRFITNGCPKIQSVNVTDSVYF
jgi:sporulation protein YlmC with PRC-barrel domain